MSLKSIGEWELCCRGDNRRWLGCYLSLFFFFKEMTFPSKIFLKLCMISKGEVLTWYDRQAALGHWEQRLETEAMKSMWFVLSIGYWLTFVLRQFPLFLPTLASPTRKHIICATMFSWNKGNPQTFWSLSRPSHLFPGPSLFDMSHMSLLSCVSAPVWTLFPCTSVLYTARHHQNPSFHDLMQRDPVLGRLPGCSPSCNLLQATVDNKHISLWQLEDGHCCESPEEVNWRRELTLSSD